MAQSQDELLQKVFDHVLKKGRAVKNRECEEETERDGSYISGFRNFTTIAFLEMHGYRVEATQVDWRTFSPSADRNGTRFSMRISKKRKVVFKANREGESGAEIFGAQERFIRSEKSPPQSWIAQGKLPEALTTLS